MIKARLPLPAVFRRFDAESVPCIALIAMNAAGLALTGTLVADEVDDALGLPASSVPDLGPIAEEQPHAAANATATTRATRTYRYSLRLPDPAQQPSPMTGDRLVGEG